MTPRASGCLTPSSGASDNSPMSEHAWRFPFSFDPLIAEAKRRARQRRLLLAAVLLVLVAGGAVLAIRPFGLLRTSRSTAVHHFEPGGVFIGPGGAPPVSDTASVQAVSAVSRGDAWIVGSVAWRWNGHAWQNIPLARKSTVDLWSVSARAPSDAWAAGWGFRGSGPNHALIEHWNGTRWTVARLPRLHAADSMLFGVSAAGPRSAWAVGMTRYANRAGKIDSRLTRSLLLHWDGASWREQSLPWARRGRILDKVVATGPSSVWALSRGQQDSRRPSLIEHWNGTRWQAVPAPFGPNDPITGFSATAWNNAWAVGSYAQGGTKWVKYSHPLAAHWNGHSWRLTHVPDRPGNNDSALIDVAAVRSDDAWAIGDSQRLDLHGDGSLSTNGIVALLLHWDGRSWQVMSGVAPPIYDGIPAITAAADGSAWAIGDCYIDSLIVEWTNGAWEMASHPRDTQWRTGTPASWRRGPLPTCPATATAGS
jgi:hypothetical protein